MNRTLAYLGCVVLGGLVVGLGSFFYARYQSPLPSVHADTCLLEECLNGSVRYPIAELEEGERVTLIELGLEQIRLEGLIGSMVTRFGQTMQPFAGAWRVEQRQTIQLHSLFDKYGVAPATIPNAGSLGASLATTTRAACVQALDQVRHFQERLYNERNAFSGRADIRRFMQEASQSSRDSILPAFERCAKEE